MLGENHSLLSEFPQFKELILRLISSNHSFAQDAKRYDELDFDIRKLELKNSPVSDAVMLEMKKERATLKDDLYRQLISYRS